MAMVSIRADALRKLRDEAELGRAIRRSLGCRVIEIGNQDGPTEQIVAIHVPRPWVSVDMVLEARDALVTSAAIAAETGHDAAARSVLRRSAAVLTEAARQHMIRLEKMAGEP